MKIPYEALDENAMVMQKFSDEHRGELVLNIWEVCRLIGWTADEEDYWWILQSSLWKHKDRGYLLSSGVFDLISLREALSDNDYHMLDDMWKMNYESKDEVIAYLKKDKIDVM